LKERQSLAIKEILLFSSMMKKASFIEKLISSLSLLLIKKNIILKRKNKLRNF
jgi:hypothetical protein